jgi:hypothetical protein
MVRSSADRIVAALLLLCYAARVAALVGEDRQWREETWNLLCEAFVWALALATAWEVHLSIVGFRLIVFLGFQYWALAQPAPSSTARWWLLISSMGCLAICHNFVVRAAALVEVRVAELLGPPLERQPFIAGPDADRARKTAQGAKIKEDAGRAAAALEKEELARQAKEAADRKIEEEAQFKAQKFDTRLLHHFVKQIKHRTPMDLSDIPALRFRMSGDGFVLLRMQELLGRVKQFFSTEEPEKSFSEIFEIFRGVSEDSSFTYCHFFLTRTRFEEMRGDYNLGGEVANDRLVSYFRAWFQRLHKWDISDNPRALRRLRDACERAKRALCVYPRTEFELDSLYRSQDFHADITRARFEHLCGDILPANWRVLGPQQRNEEQLRHERRQVTERERERERERGRERERERERER